VANYKLLMSNISVQQTRIMTLWNRSVKLEEEVKTLVDQVQTDSGLSVKDYIALLEHDHTSTEEVDGDQPREHAVRRWISYMDQEMGHVFRKLNTNGAQVAACGTLMSKNPVPLKLKKEAQEENALAQEDPSPSSPSPNDEPVMPGDHVGVGDELWRSVFETITNIHEANVSADNLQEHIQKINKMLVDFNEGKLIPNEG